MLKPKNTSTGSGNFTSLILSITFCIPSSSPPASAVLAMAFSESANITQRRNIDAMNSP